MNNDQITEQMNNFTNVFQEGLTAGEKYIELINRLVKTEDVEELLDSSSQLSEYVLENQYVKFPFQYKAQDYYLVFISRLLNFHNNDSLEVLINEDSGDVSGKLSQLGESAKFTFVIDTSNNGGAFFTENHSGEALFYLNLQKRMLRFNNAALINLFVERLSEVTTIIQIQQAINPLITLARYLQTDLGFSVDLGILETANETKYYLENEQMNLEVIDKLFVATEGTDYMLMNLQGQGKTGMSLQMDISSRLVLSAIGDVWSFSVEDGKNAVSFFDILIRFNLIKDWFIDNRTELEVKSDPMIFRG